MCRCAVPVALYNSLVRTVHHATMATCGCQPCRVAGAAVKLSVKCLLCPAHMHRLSLVMMQRLEVQVHSQA